MNKFTEHIDCLSCLKEAITADSTPDLDDWGYDDFWTCSDWMLWHGLVKKKYGKPEADRRFIHHWNLQTLGAHALDCRSFNTAFRDFLKKERLLDEAYGSAGILAPIGAVTDVVSSGSDVVSDTAKGAETAGKLLKWGLPLLLVGGALFLGLKIRNELRRT